MSWSLLSSVLMPYCRSLHSATELGAENRKIRDQNFPELSGFHSPFLTGNTSQGRHPDALSSASLPQTGMTEFSHVSCFMSASETGLSSRPAQRVGNWSCVGFSTTNSTVIQPCIHQRVLQVRRATTLNMPLQHHVHTKMELRGKQWQESSILADLQRWSAPFLESQCSFSLLVLHGSATLRSSSLLLSFSCPFHFWCSHFYSTLQTFSSFMLFSSLLRIMLTTGQGWQSMLGTLNLSPGSTNLKLKFWSSVESNSLCFHFSPSLPHTVALTSAGLDPGLTCCPKLPKVFPSFYQDPTAASSTCPQWMGTVHIEGVSCLQDPSTKPAQEAPQSRPCFSSGHRNTKHLLMHDKSHHNQPNPSV